MFPFWGGGMLYVDACMHKDGKSRSWIWEYIDRWRTKTNLGGATTPSMITCAMCTPWGWNSLAKHCASALNANFPQPVPTLYSFIQFIKTTGFGANNQIHACSFTYLGVSSYGIYWGRTPTEKDRALPSFHHPLQHLIHSFHRLKNLKHHWYIGQT